MGHSINRIKVHLLRNYCESGAPQKKLVVPGRALDAVKLKQIQDCIEEHLAEDIAIEDMAALVPMSQSEPLHHSFPQSNGSDTKGLSLAVLVWIRTSLSLIGFGFDIPTIVIKP